MKYYLIFSILALSACLNDEKENFQSMNNNPEWIEKIIEKRTCIEEYNYAKLIVNLFSYKETCLSKSCLSSNDDRITNKTERMNQFRILLDTSNYQEGIIEMGDTITFHLKMISKDSCFCDDRLDHYPSRISIVKTTKDIVSIGDGYVTVWVNQYDVDRWLNDTEMINYIRNYKDSVDPWFYNELYLRGLFKKR